MLYKARGTYLNYIIYTEIDVIPTYLGPCIQKQYFFLGNSEMDSSISRFFFDSLLMHKPFVHKKLCINNKNLRMSTRFNLKRFSSQRTCSLIIPVSIKTRMLSLKRS